jgi:hypothetical protein
MGYSSMQKGLQILNEYDKRDHCADRYERASASHLRICTVTSGASAANANVYCPWSEKVIAFPKNILPKTEGCQMGLPGRKAVSREYSVHQLRTDTLVLFGISIASYASLPIGGMNHAYPGQWYGPISGMTYGRFRPLTSVRSTMPIPTPDPPVKIRPRHSFGHQMEKAKQGEPYTAQPGASQRIRFHSKQRKALKTFRFIFCCLSSHLAGCEP